MINFTKVKASNIFDLILQFVTIIRLISIRFIELTILFINIFTVLNVIFLYKSEQIFYNRRVIS